MSEGYTYVVRVKADWLKACGLPADWSEMEGTMRQGRASSSAMGVCFDVTMPDGRAWVVYECRLDGFAVKEPVVYIAEVDQPFDFALCDGRTITVTIGARFPVIRGCADLSVVVDIEGRHTHLDPWEYTLHIQAA